MVNMQPGLINDTYELMLPDFRVDFHEKRPDWERGRLESCHELMKSGMVVYDIGAECGDFTALYRSWVGRDGDVIPVEPAAHQWPFILSTWANNGFEDAPRAAYVGLISDRNVGERLFDEGWPDESFEEGIPDGGFVHLKHSPNENSVTIDTLSAYGPFPDAIVIDIEGAEWHALDGARETLEQIRPLVWVSVHDVSNDPEWPGSLKGWYGKTADDLDRLMEEMGYAREELPSYGEAERFFLYDPR